MKSKSINRKTNKRVIIAIILLIVCSLATVFILLKIQPYSTKNIDTTTTSTNNSINNSTSSVDKTQDTPAININSNVSVVIVDASKYDQIFEIRAYADNVVEDGVCTYTLTSGDTTIKKETEATSSASTSSCKTLDIDINELSTSNSWNLTIEYTSSSNSYYGETSTTISTD